MLQRLRFQLQSSVGSRSLLPPAGWNSKPTPMAPCGHPSTSSKPCHDSSKWIQIVCVSISLHILPISICLKWASAMATMGPMGPIGKFGLLDQLLVSDQLPPRIQGAHVGALRPVLAGSFQIHSSKAERNSVFASTKKGDQHGLIRSIR